MGEKLSQDLEMAAAGALPAQDGFAASLRALAALRSILQEPKQRAGQRGLVGDAHCAAGVEEQSRLRLEVVRPRPEDRDNAQRGGFEHVVAAAGRETLAYEDEFRKSINIAQLPHSVKQTDRARSGGAA